MSALSDRIAAHEAAMLEEIQEKRATRAEEKAVLETCTRCGAKKILSISSHPSDLNNVEYQGVKKEGYLPDVDGICGGDDVNIDVCLECGQVQGDFPVSEDSLEEYFGEEDEDDIPY